MIRRGMAVRRPGLTLLEVLIALAIFLLSLGALLQLVSFAGQQALDAQHRGESARLAQSVLAEVVAGSVPLSGQGDTPFDEDPDYTWSMTSDAASVSGLNTVTITVTFRGDTDTAFSLSQMVLDPSLRGSTQDTVTISGTSSTSSGSGASSGGSANMNSAQAPAGGSTGQPNRSSKPSGSTTPSTRGRGAPTTGARPPSGGTSGSTATPTTGKSGSRGP
ncbi:MAG: type IV pilus modification PilV family protein [Mycobacterium sp.]